MSDFSKFKINQLIKFVLVLACLVVPALAQTETGRIQGTVTDQSGAAVAGATVKITAVATNREVSVQTNADGSYSALSLPPGQYKVEVSQANFKTTTQNVTLQVQQVADLNYALEPGDVSATVEVTTDIPLVETSSSSLGAVIEGRQAVELPLNGRNVLELARLAPGVTQGVTGGFASGAGGNAETYRGGNTGGAAISVNGQRTQANNFLLDGVDNNESLVNTVNIFPSADAVREFRVQTSVATAEYGRGGGAIINTVTRSGQNRVYGSAYTFIRNDNLDARPAFNATKPEFRRGQFGGTIGGPLYLPGFNEGGPYTSLGKDKVFFFASYDGLRQFLPVAEDIATVPTVAFRNGDFSQLLNPASSGLSSAIQLRDPSTGAIVAGNIINPARLNQAALRYLRAFPLPNNGNQVLGNYRSVRNQTTDQNVFDFRIDANINTANQMFIRGNYGKYDQVTDSRLPALPAGFGAGSNPTRTRGLTIGLNTTITPTIFNELRVQGNRIRYGYEPPFGDQAVSANLGIVNANRDSSLGGGALIGGYNGQLEYTGDFGSYRVPQNTLQLVDSLSLVSGNHTFKFGGTILHREVQLFRPIAGKGYFRIYGNGDFTQCPGAAGAPSLAASGTTGFEQADLLIGFACSYQIGVNNGPVGTRNWENAVFGQDDWKVTPKLTLNLGLRYEYLTNPAERYARQANFNLATGGLVLATDGKDTLTNTDKNNFSPRVGFAYDLFGKGKSVVRGGYGIFYFLDRGGIDNQLAQNAPFSGSSSYSYNDGYRITFTGQGPLFNNNNAAATNPLPLPAPNTSAAFLNNPLNSDVLAILPDNKTSNVQQFNVQLQHQLTGNTALSIGYVGTRASNLSLYYNLNGTPLSTGTSIPCPIAGRTRGNCYPGLGAVNVRDDIGRSRYDSLQIQLERRFTKGWQYLAAYTFSKTRDNGEGAFDRTASGINYVEPYGISRLDYPHVLSFQTVYQLPYGRGRQFGENIPKALDFVIGGWQINSIFRAQSGNPFDVRLNNRLVNVSGDPYTNNDNNTPYLRRAAFTAVTTGIGNLERNSLRSPSTYQLNFGLSKDFNFTETTRLQFRAEAFNVFNTIQWGNPNGDLNNASTFDGFGTIRGTAPFSNRQVQLGMRLSF